MRVACILWGLVLIAGEPHSEWVDLSYSFDESTIYWPTAKTFDLEVEFKGHTETGHYYSAHRFQASEHGGTHLDAPIHFAEGKHAVDEISVDRLMGPGVVVDVSERALADRDYLVSVDDLKAFEASHGAIPDGAFVMLRTGYGQFWPDRVQYMGTDKLGPEAVALLHFPGLAPEAAQWLVDNRQIEAIGLDTPSIDYGQSKKFKSHVILGKRNIAILENVANLEALPATGAWIVALPMKIKGGSGGPTRIIARLP